MRGSALRTELPEHLVDPMAGLLLALADDEFVLGFIDSEWTGIAPMLEEDVAMSSIAQDEIGHAAVYYGLLADLRGTDPDTLAYEREPAAYRHARLMDHPRTDWAFTAARRYLYETADRVRLDFLVQAGWAPLAGMAEKIRREETYHQRHMTEWVRRLAEAGGESRERLVSALKTLWPDAPAVFTATPGEQVLVEEGVLPAAWSGAVNTWLSSIYPFFSGLEIPFPFRHEGGKDGFSADFELLPERGRQDHSEAFEELWEQFTEVRRSDPEASW